MTRSASAAASRCGHRSWPAIPNRSMHHELQGLTSDSNTLPGIMVGVPRRSNVVHRPAKYGSRRRDRTAGAKLVTRFRARRVCDFLRDCMFGSASSARSAAPDRGVGVVVRPGCSPGHSAVPGGHESTELIVCPRSRYLRHRAPQASAEARPCRRDATRGRFPRMDTRGPGHRDWPRRAQADHAQHSSSFLDGSAPRTQHPGVTLEVSGGTGQKQEEFTMMGGFGNGMGSLGWLGMGVLLLVLVGLTVWLVVRPRDRN